MSSDYEMASHVCISLVGRSERSNKSSAAA